ncbi:glycosyltransferase [Novosphingobium sp. KCTC 2891]|uniref:glycosyltransferase n=1 Tax=Novosphingobium sp. KCTC 2891 TaxID=2989730 RepID=UPI0022232B1A|nr:glycosyltransferase [Novosphingobium sp. KCTC 2891]MCW1383274.1 glycosyltransferase [Novosphingobium sp. KCTC 2891]
MTGSTCASPAFSIIVPTYQRRDLVCEAVEAIGRIVYDGALELVVVVDGSTDGTAEALEGIALPFPCTIIVQPNGGLAHARNTGAAAASGEILFFLDDDMICRPDIVAQHARSYAEGADAVVGEIPLEANSPRGFLTEGIAAWAEKSAVEARSREVLSPFNVFGGQISMRRSVFDELGGFDAGYTAGGKYGKEDADIAVKLLARYVVRHNPDAVSLHRYVVEPREYLRRGYELGRADVRFARRHLAHAAEIFEISHASHPVTRFVLRPLARVPGLHRLLAMMGALAAEALLRSPWRSSRTFARIFFCIRMVGYWAGVNECGGMPSARKALILCYHAIADHSDDPVLYPYSIPQPRFEAHLASLERRGFAFVTPQDLLDCLEGRVLLPRRAVLLTFDDCYADLLEVARDILAPRGIPALAFAITGMASHTNEWDQKIGAKRRQLLDWQQVAQLPRHGVEVGCHSRSHPRMPTLDAARLAEETRGAGDDFVAHGLPRPRFFCYPFGERDAKACAAVEAAGYAAGFGLADCHAVPASPRYDLPRIELLSWDGGFRFWLKTTFPKPATYLRWGVWRDRLARELRALVRKNQPTAAGVSAPSATVDSAS